MGQGMSQVLPGVYVTSALVARRNKVLDEYGITHVISVQAKPINPFDHVEYLLIPARDHISQDLLQFGAQCNDFIHGARLKQGKVLIHCVEGKSRSPSIACIYIMTITGISWSDAINSIRGVRTLVDPNFSFQRQLKYFNEHYMMKERERLFQKFGEYNKIEDDIAFVMKNLSLYNEEQLRLTGNYVKKDQTCTSTKSVNQTTSSENGESKSLDEPNQELDDFFQSSDPSPMTPNSQTLLDEFFAS